MALGLFDPAWGIEVTRNQSTDWEITATVLLGLVSWQLGEVERARVLIEQAKKRADKSQHGVTLANAYMFSTMFEVFRGDAESALRALKLSPKSPPGSSFDSTLAQLEFTEVGRAPNSAIVRLAGKKPVEP